MVKLYAINSAAMLDSEQQFEHKLLQALDGGVHLFQLRDKRPDFQTRLATAQRALALCTQAQVPLIINDDVELARQIGASGVHLGQGDTAVAQARARLGEAALIGVSCHDQRSLAAAAIAQGASYVAFGRLFESRTKPTAPAADLDYVTQHIRSLSIQSCVIGGINAGNLPMALSTGAELIAVIEGIFGATDVRQAAQQLRQQIDQHNQIRTKAIAP